MCAPPRRFGAAPRLHEQRVSSVAAMRARSPPSAFPSLTHPPPTRTHARISLSSRVAMGISTRISATID
eukprot:638246-Pleurochrysis_carterae.AAC.1